MGRVCILDTSLLLRCTTQNIAPQLLQPAGGPDEVILERESGEMRDKTNEKRGLHAEGILSRMGHQTIVKSLCVRLLER